MHLEPLNNEARLEEIASSKDCHVILKHNTTCSISQGVYERLKAEAKTINGVDTVYLLDLMANRDLSNKVAGQFGVPHQSPQVLLIKNGRCIYHEWGFDISAEAIAAAAE